MGGWVGGWVGGLAYLVDALDEGGTKSLIAVLQQVQKEVDLDGVGGWVGGWVG